MDGVRMAVISHRLDAVVGAMMNTIFRSGRSGVLNSAHDFSCCVISADDQLVMGAESLPIHMMSGPDLISKAIKKAHPELRKGDAFLHNSPYAGNSHAADYSMLVPVFDGAGKHRFSVLAKAHQADCGNSQPTTYMATASDVYEEGALLFDAFRAQTDYTDNQDLIRACRLRIRVPDQWWGDYLALLGAVRVGEKRVMDLGDDIGWNELDDFVTNWFDYSETSMRSVIQGLPSGKMTVSTHHDPFPGVPDGVKVQATIEILSSQGRIEIDLRNNVDCLPNGLNLTEATSRTAALVGVFNSIGATVPPNAGSFRRVDVLLRENCAVGIPVHPASCSTATTNLADRVANAVQRGIAELCNGYGLAEVGAVIPAAAGVVSGHDPRKGGEPFVNQIFMVITGGAGAPTTDAWLTTFHAGGAGMLRRDSVEVAERRHPLRVYEQRIVPDTEGAGRFRGAPSARVEYGPIGTSMVVAYGSDGAVNPALGTRGGLEGAACRHMKRTVSGELVDLPPLAIAKLEDGERIISMTCGGGGYGPPHERDAAQVQRDVIEGWISKARAKATYGVGLTDKLELDLAETTRLRQDALKGH